MSLVAMSREGFDQCFPWHQTYNQIALERESLLYLETTWKAKQISLNKNLIALLEETSEANVK